MQIEVQGCIVGFHNTTDYSSCGKRTAEIEREIVERIIQNEPVKQIVLNLTEPELIIDEPDRPLTMIENTIYFFYQMIPVKEGALRNFLVNLGK